MKSTIAIGVTALLPFLVLFTVIYFGMHKLLDLLKVTDHSGKLSSNPQARQTISI